MNQTRVLIHRRHNIVSLFPSFSEDGQHDEGSERCLRWLAVNLEEDINVHREFGLGGFLSICGVFERKNQICFCFTSESTCKGGGSDVEVDVSRLYEYWMGCVRVIEDREKEQISAPKFWD